MVAHNIGIEDVEEDVDCTTIDDDDDDEYDSCPTIATTTTRHIMSCDELIDG
jgi:hypothetical protein